VLKTLVNLLKLKPLSGGDVLVNGQKVTKKFKSVSAYVQQDDILDGNLTVFEALMFTALLRLPWSYSIAQKKQKVLDVIEELGLTHTKNTKIGIPGLTKGISGGERKRVSIGVELLTSPSVLFLDEPTSGLDSKTALSIMETINKLAKQNHTVICTIHQPRSDIFKLFDKLLLLSAGQIAYFGDAKNASGYFQNLGYPMPKNYNPADFYIDLITLTANDTQAEAKKKQADVDRTKLILKHHRENVKVEVPPEKAKGIRNVSKYSTLWINEFIILFVRSFISVMRGTGLIIARTMQTVIMSVLVGFIYFQFKHNQKTINDRIGCLFFIMIK
jgi:ABC-type multidrug transport system ATPase subunit